MCSILRERLEHKKIKTIQVNDRQRLYDKSPCEKTQKANKCELCILSVMFRKMQIGAKMKYHLIPVKLSKLKQLTVSVVKRKWKLGDALILLGKVEIDRLT